MRLPLYLAVLVAWPLAGCSTQPPLPEACESKPQSGRCRAAIPRYWFDQGAGNCRAFIWGGCDGVVPFETLEQCHTQCRPGVPLPAGVPGIKQPLPEAAP